MATITKRTAIIVPTRIIKAAMLFIDSKSAHPSCRCVNVCGTTVTNPDGTRLLDLRVRAYDSIKQIEARWTCTFTADDEIETPEKFDWAFRPDDNITGSAPYVRMEIVDEGIDAGKMLVRTFESKNPQIARKMAITNVNASKCYVWGIPADSYPNVDRLWQNSITTVGNALMNAPFVADLCKAASIATGVKNIGVEIVGVGSKGGEASPIEFAAHSDDVHIRMQLMPCRGYNGKKMSKGSINGADPAELESLRKAFDEIHQMNAEKAKRIEQLESENAELRSELTNGSSFSDDYDAMELAYERKCGQVDELTALVAELNEKLAAKEAENAELRRSWEALCKYAYDEGATVPESQVGIVKSDEPEPEQPAENVDEPPALPAPAEVVDAIAIDTIDTVWIPDGCTVSIAKGGNVWLDGPVSMLKKLSKQLKAAGWIPAPKRIPQGKPWWYRRFAAC